MANNVNASANASANNKQPAATKDSAQEEEQLEDMLYRLDQVHLQASLLRSHLSPPPWRCSPTTDRPSYRVVITRVVSAS